MRRGREKEGVKHDGSGGCLAVHLYVFNISTNRLFCSLLPHRPYSIRNNLSLLVFLISSCALLLVPQCNIGKIGRMIQYDVLALQNLLDVSAVL